MPGRRPVASGAFWPRGAGVGDLGAANDCLTAAVEEEGPGPGVGDLGATDDLLTVAGEAEPGVGDVAALVGEEAGSDSGGDLTLSVGELMVEYRLRRPFSYGSQV